MMFHPDKNLPNCMLPDGGECCVGHAAVVEDWHRQNKLIEWLRDAITTKMREVEHEREVFNESLGRELATIKSLQAENARLRSLIGADRLLAEHLAESATAK